MERKNTFTIRFSDLELSTIDRLLIATGGRDRAEVIRGLLWRAGRDEGVLTDGDIRELSKRENRGKKTSTKRSVTNVR